MERTTEREAMTTDDQPTITVDIPERTAQRILDYAGYYRADSGEWVTPNGRPRSEGGHFGSDFLWERDEALTRALNTVALGLVSNVA